MMTQQFGVYEPQLSDVLCFVWPYQNKKGISRIAAIIAVSLETRTI